MSKHSAAESGNSGPTTALRQDIAPGGGQFGGADLTDDRYAYLDSPSPPAPEPPTTRRPPHAITSTP